jgi:superfamily I DNA/RNA helicase
MEQHDAGRLPKVAPEFTQRESGEVLIHNCPSDDREAEIIAAIIKDEVNATEKEARSALILVPTRNYAKKLEATLTSFRLGYSFRLGDSKPIQMLLLTRKWAEKTTDNLLTRQVMQFVIESGQCKIPGRKSRTVPKLKIREKALKAIAGLWDEVILRKKHLIVALREICDGNPECADLLEKLGLVKTTYETDFGEFLKTMSCYIRPWSGMAAFFSELETMERSKQRPAPVGKFQVRIMSFQSSKGLEANIVLVIGLEEGQYPSDDSPDRIAEAARLVFVAMTRAQDKLHLFHARKRTGSVSLRDKSHQLSQSRFLTGLKIPKENRIYHPAKT